MSVHKDKKTNTWRVLYRYTDYTGKTKQTSKRGFATKREALAWERENTNKMETKLDMTFASFVEIYTTDLKRQVKENTWMTKEHVIHSKILPYFKDRRICDIAPKDILAWQNDMLHLEGADGKPLSPAYLKTIHNQLSAIFNHACKYYDLPYNPAAKVGNMGKATSREMLFWTQDEYKLFSEQTMEKPQFFYAVEILYWCGIREGELLALTSADFDFDRNLLSITKSYQRLNGRDVITDPKTPKSNRKIKMPDFLVEEIKDYLKLLYGLKPTDRIFDISKASLHHEMTRASEAAGVKRIRIHDLRHSHISLLIEMGFSAVAIADRVGHESTDITFHYAHLFPSTQQNMADQLNALRGGLNNVS